MRGRPRGEERLATGELEARVINVLWDAEVALTSGEVSELLPAGHPLAYTTVMTILVRLYEKGAVTRERRGRAWAYRAAQTREEHTASRMAELLRSGGDSPAALARFVDHMSNTERAALRRLLQRRRRTS